MALNIIAWHNNSMADHKQKTADNAAKGYRTLSLSVYGERDAPLYAAVMIKRPNLVQEEQHCNLSKAQLQTKLLEMTAKGWAPYRLSATGPVNNPLFAVSFQPSAAAPLVKLDLTEAQLQAENQAHQKSEKYILYCADAYGTANDMRYAAVWYPNTENIAWNCDSLNEPVKESNLRRLALVNVWARGVHIAVTPAQNILALYHDTSVGIACVTKMDLSSAEYQKQFDKYTAKELYPVCVSANGSGADIRFAVIFAAQEEVNARVFRTTGPATIPGIDAAVEAIMKANQLRGASLAITKGARLVYAKGYTWAEPEYPTVYPTNLFRQASVSKMFTALAIYKLIEQGKLTLNTTLQSILNIKTPTNDKPKSPAFDQITIRHLLEMTSGVDTDNPELLRRDIEIAAAFKTQLPVTTAQVASFAAAQEIKGTPGDPAKAHYSAGGYFLLSQVVAKLYNAATFEDALQKAFLSDIGALRVKQSITDIFQQDANEVNYHPRPLTVERSVVLPDQPLALTGYGEANWENFDGAGGLSAAATDVARVLAALTIRNNNPMLAESRITEMLKNAAAVCSNPAFKAHGYYGFDKVVEYNSPKGTPDTFYGYKGGTLSTSQNSIYIDRNEEGFGFVVNWNGRTPHGEKWYPNFPGIMKEAQKQNWGNTDLFPQFGMPSFDVPNTPFAPDSPSPSIREKGAVELNTPFLHTDKVEA